MSIVAAGIGAGVSVGIAGYGSWKSGKDKEKAQDAMDAMVKPVYSIPQEVKDNLSDAENMAVEGLPAEQKREYVQNIERSQVTNRIAGKGRKEGLANLQASTNKSNDAYTNLVSKDAQARSLNKKFKQSSIERARGALAAHKDKKFGFEQGNYNTQLASHQGDYQAAAQSQHNAQMSIVNSIGSAAGSVVGSKINSVNNSGTSLQSESQGFPSSGESFSSGSGANMNLGDNNFNFNPLN